MDENVRKLSEALAATTPGVWIHADRDGPYVNVVDGIRWLGDAMTISDGKFFVEAHNRLPVVLAQIDRLTAELEEARLTLAAEKQRRSRMPSDNPDRLLAEVNAERIRRNLSWRDLATRLDVATSALTRWNNGRCPSIAVYLNAREWLAVMRAAADTYDTSK